MNATSQTSSLDLERFFVLDDTRVLEDNEVSFLKTPFENGVDLKWKPVILASSQGGEEQLDTEAGPSNQGVGVGLSEKNAEALPSIDNQGGRPKRGQEGKDKGSIGKAPIMPAKPVHDGKRGGKADKGKGKAEERPSKKRKLYHTTYKVVDNDFRDWRGNAKMAYQVGVVLTDKMWRLSVTPETQKYEVIWPHSLAKEREIMQSVIASQVTCVLYNQDEPYLDGLPISDVFPLSFFEAVTNSDVSLDHIDVCEQLITNHPIHIPSPKRTNVSPELSKDRCLDCEDLEMAAAQCFTPSGGSWQLRDEKNYLNEIVSTTMKEVILDNQPAVNFLDIPNPAGVFPPQFLRVLSLDSLASQRPMGPGFPQYSSKWKLMATSPALSRAHYDAGKYSMWIRIECGCKFWATLVGEIPTCPLTELVVEDHKWKVFVLEEDVILIMTPGTVHIVLTTRPSVAEGGHFYSKYDLVKSFFTGLQERKHGSQDTNTQHVASELVLQGLASSYADFIHDIAYKKISKPNSPLYNHVVGRC
ncbi:hypothetical protein K439DRAFT_1625608 [Ramaria rubella]|nr:hypothetical protein K439DRAFT_1625608 [Ramaria rubella]